MRIFYSSESGVKCIDTKDTPIFINCLPEESEFLSNPGAETDSFCIYGETSTQEEIEEFMKDVYILSDQMNEEIEE